MKTSMFAPCGRVYAASETGERLLRELPPNALRDAPGAAAALVATGAVVPSLTSVIGYSRVLVTRNSAVSGALRLLQQDYLSAVKAASPVLPDAQPVKSAMRVGTAVHRVAEMYLQGTPWAESVTAAEAEARTMEERFDWEAFRLYSEALRSVLHASLLASGHNMVEKTVFGEGWAGTADVITHREVGDWKTGKTLSLSSAIMQAVVLAKTVCRPRAVIIHLGQDSHYRAISVTEKSEIWQQALDLYAHAVTMAHERIAEEPLVLNGVTFRSPGDLVAALQDEITPRSEPVGVTHGVRHLLHKGVPAVESGAVREAPW